MTEDVVAPIFFQWLAVVAASWRCGFTFADVTLIKFGVVVFVSWAVVGTQEAAPSEAEDCTDY